MTQYSTIQFEQAEGVAHITLNRPPANSVNLELSREFMDVALRCDEDPSVRVVVLSGAGAMFCGGGDVKHFAAQQDNLPLVMKEVTCYLHSGISRLTRMNAPVIGAVHGSAAGAGLSLACACDIVIAGESAKFTVAYTKIGLTPDGSATYFLPRIAGLRRALELTLTNRVFGASEALAMGIATRVVPDSDVLKEAMALAAQLASGPTLSFGAVKRLYHGGLLSTLETQMEIESRAIADACRTQDGQEGIRSFAEKRAAKFAGR